MPTYGQKGWEMDQPMVAPEQQTGYTIEIDVLPDGTFNVSKSDLAEETAEDNATPDADAGQTASSLGEALKLVLELVKANGDTRADQEAQFDKGYAGPMEQTQ